MAEMKKFEALKREVIKNGGFFVHFYFDMHANNSAALQDIMVGFVGKLTKEAGVRMAVGEIDEPIAHEDMFSSTAKVSMLVDNLTTMTVLALNYAPIGVEIDEPTQAQIDANDIQQAMIRISATTQELTHHIITKTMDDAERAHFHKQMAQRAQLGRRLMTDKDGEKTDSTTSPKADG